MKYKYKRFLFRWNPGRLLITWLKRVKFRKYENVSLYKILKLFIQNLTDDEILDRDNGVAYNFLLAIFPAIIFLFTLIPYVIAFCPEVNNDSIMEFLGSQRPPNMYEPFPPPCWIS